MKKKKEKKKDGLLQKCDEYLTGWKRALADYENLKRNQDQSLSEGKKNIKISFVQDLLPVMDNFEQAVKHAPDINEVDASLKTWLQGVLFIQKQFEDVVNNMGLERIKTIGEIFNPELHDAVETRREDDKQENEILEEVLPGWAIQDYIVRSAKVIINNKENKK